MQFPIGAEVACSDGVCGHLIRVVVNPVARTVTHLVVEPTRRSGLGRLVPIDLVETSGAQVQLRCVLAEFAELAIAEDTEFLPGMGSAVGYDPQQVSAWPYYGLGGNAILPVVHERVPLGEIEVRRGEQVMATDGTIGRVQGLVIDPVDHHVTHVLLQEGHIWGRKEVAIPISAVKSVADGILVGLTKAEVGDLPAVDIQHPNWE